MATTVRYNQETDALSTYKPLRRASSSSATVVPLLRSLSSLQHDVLSELKPNRSTALFTTFSTLVMTMVGSGLLSIPYLLLLAPLEYVLGTLFVVGICMTFTSSLLIELHDQTKLSTLSELAYEAFGPAFSTFTTITTAFALLGAGTGSVQIFLDIGPSFMPYFGLPASPIVTILGLFVVVIPVALCQSISALRFTSYIGLFASIYLILAVVFHSMSSTTPMPQSPHSPQLVWHLVHIASIFNFGFVNHLNVIPLYETITLAFSESQATILPSTYGSMTKTTKSKGSLGYKRMQQVLVGVGAFVLGIYAIFGYCALKLYGTSTQGNILSNLEEDGAMALPSLAVFCTVLLSFPLLFHPLVQLSESIVWKAEVSTFVRAFDSFVLLGLLILLSTTMPGIQGTFSLTGGSCVTLICYIFPIACYIRLCHQSTWRRYAACTIGFAGAIVGALATFSVLTGMQFSPST